MVQRLHHGFWLHAASHAGMLRRYVPVPKVSKEDRLLFMPLPVPGLYRCVARYGYASSQRHFQSAALCMIESVAGMAGSLCASSPMLQSAAALYRHIVCWVSFRLL